MKAYRRAKLVLALLVATLWLLVLVVAAPARASDTSPRAVRAAIQDVFGPRWPKALCIARHESRLDPRAVGDAGERGLFQIHPVHFSWARPSRLFDPRWNARVAYRLSKGGRSWGPWTTRGMCQ